MKPYVIRKGKVLRRGFTTGTYSAAAAKAAVSMLFGVPIDTVKVELPIGAEVKIKISKAFKEKGKAVCCVVKDAGDDPDVTHKAEICVKAKKISKGIELKGGEGVGIVTKPGLQVRVGEPAINPVPRKMIFNEIKKVLPKGAGVEVTVFVPKGEELAKKTMNERLGIVGGISILGTTGVVEPMSEEAFKESLVPQIGVALAQGYKEVVLTPGRIGEKNALKLGIPEDAIVQMGNFVGFMLRECAKRGVEKAVLFGHVGKLTKVAAGFFNTHSKISDSRIETITRHAIKLGIEEDIICMVMDANTAEHALQILKDKSKLHIFDSIAEEVVRKAVEFAGGKMEIGAALLSLDGEIVGKYNLEACRWGKYML